MDQKGWREQVEKRTNKIEDRTLEIAQSKQQKDGPKKKNEYSLGHL